MNPSRTYLAALLVVSLCGSARAGDTAADATTTAAKVEELKRFQGTWIVASMDICERRSSPEQETKFVVAGQTLSIPTERGAASALEIEIDPTKTPKELDLKVNVNGAPQVRRAIYEYDREALRICFGAIDGLERPRDFTTIRRPYVTVVLRRAAP